MKRAIVVLSLCALLTACGQPANIDGKIYGTYGFLNEATGRNPNIQYQLIFGNIVWSALLAETLIAPIYFLGFSLWEPVGKKDASFEPGVIGKAAP